MLAVDSSTSAVASAAFVAVAEPVAALVHIKHHAAPVDTAIVAAEFAAAVGLAIVGYFAVVNAIAAVDSIIAVACRAFDFGPSRRVEKLTPIAAAQIDAVQATDARAPADVVTVVLAGGGFPAVEG